MKQFLNKLVSLPVELWQSRKLIWKLAKNDFKTKYAGSYLGIIWAFVQPVITILVYWLVFEKGFSAKAEMFKSGVEVPFVVYLTSGLVPWFFFSEAVSSSTNALIEYNYLVKKVVFKISILPLIKILAACFIHVFFVGPVLRVLVVAVIRDGEGTCIIDIKSAVPRVAKVIVTRHGARQDSSCHRETPVAGGQQEAVQVQHLEAVLAVSACA